MSGPRILRVFVQIARQIAAVPLAQRSPCNARKNTYLSEMLHFIRAAALAATLSLVPAASLSSAPQAEVRHAVVRTDTASVAPQKPAPAPLAEFGLDAAHDHEHASGLAPGQTAEDFEA